MNGFPLRLTFLALLASAALAQQAPESTPAGGTANEQQQTAKTKKLAPKKIYTNADLASSETRPEAEKNSPTNPVAGSAAVKTGDSSTPAAQAASGSEKTNRSEAETLRSSVLDAPQQNSPDVIVVPAGTEIKVDISEENPLQNMTRRVFSGKVTVPVRVGWVAAFPALTHVTVQISLLYYLVPGPHYPGSMPNENNLYSVEVAQLTSVRLDGTTYALQTDQIPVLLGSEVTFTLLNDITLKR